MPKTSPARARWLSMSAASKLLGVHPSTLRRWADRGQVPVMLTPGGHRRFAVGEIRRFAERHTGVQASIEETWAGKALTSVRERITRSSRARWLDAHSADERSEYRQLGRRLMSVAMHFIADTAHQDALLEEARSIGREQARHALAHGLALTDALAAVLFFRDTLLEVALQVPHAAQPKPEASAWLVRRINQLLNAVQLAIGETYERALLAASR